MDELIELINEHDFYWSMIDEQQKWEDGFRKEKRIKELMKNYLWEDIESHIKDEWRKKRLQKLF